MADQTNAPAQPAAPKPAVSMGSIVTAAGTTVIGIPTLVELIDYGVQVAHLQPVPSPSAEAALAAVIIGGFNFALALIVRGRAALADILEGEKNA